MDDVYRQQLALCGRTALVNDHVAMADGAIRIPKSSDDDGRWAYLVVPFDERLDGLDGVDSLGGTEQRWSALFGRAHCSMIA